MSGLIKIPSGDLYEAVSTSLGKVSVLLNAVIATGPGTAITPVSPDRGFQAVLTCSSGNCSATVLVEASNDGTNWFTLGTITFASAASPQNDAFGSVIPWMQIRGNVSAIAGTNAAVTLTMVQ